MIGAGSSGIASCQVLDARGIEFDCFEVGSEVGGNWRYMNDNGMSAAYRSLHINTSRRTMAYAAYPMPEDLPDYPNHFQIAKYFDDYVDHFGFRDQHPLSHRGDACRAEGRRLGGLVARPRLRLRRDASVYSVRDRRQWPPLESALARARRSRGRTRSRASRSTSTPTRSPT